MYRQKKNYEFVTYMRERAKRASASEIYVFSGLKIHLHTYTINVVPFYWFWYGAINDSVLTKHYHWEKSMNMRASGASELRKFSHLLILKPLFPSFCWYFRFFVSETYIFSGLQLHLHNYTCTINAVSFHYLWYGTIYNQYADKTLTLRKYICERAERASLETFCIFTF